ncbi:MAG: hypothetical protein NT051_05135 [Candidatus Micrarchaeota archaeon]|nr:hypothetical protein [Candidatus Micrarchaeota archaeon]
MEKFGLRDVYAILMLALVAVGIGQFVPKATLPEFGFAVQLFSSLSGASVAPHVAVHSALLGVYSSIAGANPASPETITGFMLLAPGILLALVSAFLYLAFRSSGKGKAVSASAALVFALSVSTLAFLPGVISSAQLACLAFAAMLLCLILFSNGQKLPFALLAVVLGAAAACLDFPFAIAVMLIALLYAARVKKNGEKMMALAPYAILVLAAIVGAVAGMATLGQAGIGSFSTESLLSSFSSIPFLMAAASIPVALFIFGEAEIAWLAFFAGGILLCGFNPLAGASLLALPSAEGIGRALEGKMKKPSMLCAAFFACFFTCFALASLFFSSYSAIVASALGALLAPIILHLYEYHGKAFFAVLMVLVVALAFFLAVAEQVRTGGSSTKYASQDLTGALLYLSSKQPSQPSNLVLLERQDAAGFYLPKTELAQLGQAKEYLLSGKGSFPSNTYIVLTPSVISLLSENSEFALYSFAGRYASGNNRYAVFASAQGNLVSRPLTSSGNFALSDGAYIDSAGRQYATIPLSQMMMLSSSNNVTGRMIVLEEGTAPPKFVELYSGNGGAEIEKEFGETVVLRVK